MQFLFKIDSIPYGFLVIFGFYGLTVQGLKICILALLAPNNINLWFLFLTVSQEIQNTLYLAF